MKDWALKEKVHIGKLFLEMVKDMIYIYMEYWIESGRDLQSTGHRVQMGASGKDLL